MAPVTSRAASSIADRGAGVMKPPRVRFDHAVQWSSTPDSILPMGIAFTSNVLLALAPTKTTRSFTWRVNSSGNGGKAASARARGSNSRSGEAATICSRPGLPAAMNGAAESTGTPSARIFSNPPCQRTSPPRAAVGAASAAAASESGTG